jgi:hypothetical protein
MGRTRNAVSIVSVGRPTVQAVYGGMSSGMSVNQLIGGCKVCLPNVPFITSLTDFVTLLETLRTSIDMYFPAMHIMTPLTGDMKIGATVNIRIYARLMWIQKYKPVYGSFDMTDIVHINLLKDIFISLGYDWTMDALLKDWPNNIPS